MHNLVILGCPRSGTSTVAGLMVQSNYWMGDALWEGDVFNPKGYFEDALLIRINEDILAPYMESPLKRAGHDPAVKEAPSKGYWFGHLDLEVSPRIRDEALLSQMRQFLTRRPFCLKDPQFCYTFDVWQPLLDDTHFICVFRDPGSTVASIMNMCNTRDYYKSCNIDQSYASQLWYLMYRRILDRQSSEFPWLFIHYDQLFDGPSLDRLEDYVGHALARDFPEKSIKKSVRNAECSAAVKDVYQELCLKANYGV